MPHSNECMSTQKPAEHTHGKCLFQSTFEWHSLLGIFFTFNFLGDIWTILRGVIGFKRKQTYNLAKILNM